MIILISKILILKKYFIKFGCVQILPSDHRQQCKKQQFDPHQDTCILYRYHLLKTDEKRNNNKCHTVLYTDVLKILVIKYRINLVINKWDNSDKTL